MTLPFSRKAEMVVLGNMLINPSVFEVGIKALGVSDFYCKEHQLIFDTLVELHKQHKCGNIFLVSDELKKKNGFKAIGGGDYLMILTQCDEAFGRIEEYIQDLIRFTQMRKLILLAQEAIELTFDLISSATKSREKYHPDIFKEIFNDILPQDLWSSGGGPSERKQL